MRRSVGVVLPPDLPTAQFFPYIQRAEDLGFDEARSYDRREFASRLPDGWVDRLAITGTAANGQARIAALHDAGADSVVSSRLAPIASQPSNPWPGCSRRAGKPP